MSKVKYTYNTFMLSFPASFSAFCPVWTVFPSSEAETFGIHGEGLKNEMLFLSKHWREVKAVTYHAKQQKSLTGFILFWSPTPNKRCCIYTVSKKTTLMLHTTTMTYIKGFW